MKHFYILFLLISSITFAQYEGFNYTTAVSLSGWGSHGGILGELFPITTASDNGNSLNVTGAVAVPIGNRVQLNPSVSTTSFTEDVDFQFSAPVTTTAYASFFVKVTSDASLTANTTTTPPIYFFHFMNNIATTTGWVSRIGMRKGSAAGTVNIGVLNSTGGAAGVTDLYGATPIDYAMNTTHLIVVKYQTGTSTTHATSIWIDPVLSSTEPAATHTSGFGTSATTSIQAISLRQAAALPVLEIDEIRMGTSWANVVTPLLAVDELKKIDSSIKLSNTLVKDQFTVFSDEKVTVELFSSIGQTLKKVVSNNTPIDVSNLQAGTYFVRISNEKESTVKKIIKR